MWVNIVDQMRDIFTVKLCFLKTVRHSHVSHRLCEVFLENMFTPILLEHVSKELHAVVFPFDIGRILIE